MPPSKADSAVVWEYRKTGEAPGLESQCGGSWHFFMKTGEQYGHQITLTETQWVALGKPSWISATIENADEEA